MKRIFPLDLNASSVTYYNYSNYLNWICYDANTLQDYLDYFNPNFQIYNETLYYISSNNWQETQNYLGTIQLPDDQNYYNISELKLKWRQGVFNPEPNRYIKLGEKLYPFPLNSTIFARKWTHSGNQDEDNSFFSNINNYFIMVHPLASLYTIRAIADAFQFDWIENGQAVLGTNITFSLEGAANRYIMYDSNKASWGSGTEWSISGVHWEDKMSLLVGTNSNQVWTNSFPLMHELRIKNGDNASEEFIVDQSFEITNTNIANHSTVLYTIKVGNVTIEETSNWSQVFVNII